jgi:toxin ParE1/3/4
MHVLRRLRERIEKLAQAPGIGHTRGDLSRRPVRFWSEWSYYIVYETSDRGILVVRVLHGARDIEDLLSDED